MIKDRKLLQLWDLAAHQWEEWVSDPFSPQRAHAVKLK